MLPRRKVRAVCLSLRHGGIGVFLLIIPPSFCSTLRFTRSYADCVYHPNVGHTISDHKKQLEPEQLQFKRNCRGRRGWCRRCCFTNYSCPLVPSASASACRGTTIPIPTQATSVGSARQWHHDVSWQVLCASNNLLALLHISPTSIVQLFDVKCDLTCQDPSDPSTFPQSSESLSPSTTVIHTTARTEGVHSGNSIRPYDRSRYPGLPLV